MVVFPGCKINLGLNVIRRRPDGFHDIETVFFPVPLHDVLEAVPSPGKEFSFHSSGLEIPGDAGQNLCVRAYHLLSEKYGLPAVAMHLHKVIPMGAGLGGGSSDGAFALKLLNELFETGLTERELAGYARQLGSDCSFFLESKPCYGSGRGDRLEPVEIDLSGYTLALVAPGIHVSTAEAYGAVTPAIPRIPVKDIMRLPVMQWKDCLVNDFELPVFRKYPVLGEIRDTLYERGAVYASMTGSGSALFGIFPEKPALSGQFTGCFTWTS